MCGIHFTVQTDTFTTGLDDFLRDAFIANQVRGVDSSGMFQIKNTYSIQHKDQRDVSLFKQAKCGTEFVEENNAKGLLLAARSCPATVGHVRAATAGLVNLNNAHPFIVVRQDNSRLVGVHNGTLDNWRYQDEAKDVNVDSEWAFKRIASQGLDAFKEFDGAYVFVWYDSTSPDKLFVARNDKRPLYWAHTEDKKSMIACSELGMLGWLADRRGIKLGKYDNNYRFMTPEAGHLFSIDLKTAKWDKEKLPVYDSKTRKFMPAVVHNPTTSMYNRGDARYYEDARGDDDGWSYPGTRVARRFTYDDEDQDEVLGAVKKVLSEVRNKSTKAAGKDLEVAGITPSNIPFVPLDGGLKADKDELDSIIDNEKLEEGIEKAIQAHLSQQEQDQLAQPVIANANVIDSSVVKEDEFEYVGTPLDASASKTERQRAKSLGIFGLVVNFCGYFYDEDCNEVYGDFRTIEKGRQLSYDCILRGKPKKVAEDNYIHPTKCTQMVVIGITEARGSVKPYLLISDLPYKAQITKAKDMAKASDASKAVH